MELYFNVFARRIQKRAISMLINLKQEIINYMKRQKDEVNLSELYEHFSSEKHTTIRGRIN